MTRRTLSAGMLGLFFALVGGVAHAQSDIAGVWQITLDTQTGETVWTATFEQEGGVLLGEVDIGDGDLLPL